MNKIKFFFLLISILFVSCKNFFTSDVSEKCEDKAILCISTDLLNSRTVLPIGINENMFDFSWKLVGFSVNTSFEKVWEDDITSGKTSYQSMISDNSILLDVGSWNFELTTYNKENLKVLTSSLICDLISGSNFLQFNMYEPIGAGIAPGYVDFKLNFPSNVIKKCVAKLYDLNTNVIVSDSEKVIIADNSSSLSSVVYDLNGNSIDSGYYYLIVDLQQEINNDTYSEFITIINTYTCLIRVSPGLYSRGEYELSNLATLYKIDYEKNGGTFTDTTITTSYNQYTSFTLPIPIKNGYDFKGWYSDYNYNGYIENNGTYNINQNTTVYAKWQPVNYTISYVLNGGQNVAGNPSTYTIEESINFAEPTREGYDFKGWYTDSSFNQSITKVENGSVGNITLYAKWVEKINYVQGLMFDSTSNTLYISDESGLITFGNIISGRLSDSVIVQGYNSSSDKNFSVGSVYNSLNAELTQDIVLTNDWEPMGNSRSLYSGVFDGKGYTIYGFNIDYISDNPASSEPIGFFGYGGGSIKNLVLSGTITTNVLAVGGLIGYSKKSSVIENCVTNVCIVNTGDGDYSGTAGMIGIVGKDDGVSTSITNSINIGDIKGVDNVAGFIGYIDETSTTENSILVNKCINIGTIEASNGVVAGISCLATLTSSETYIKNSINIGTLTANNAAGISYDIFKKVKVSYCVSVGNSSASTYLAIDISRSSNTNNFYDSLKINDPNTSGGTGKTTEELILGISFDDNWSSNWSFEAGRYPLPNIQNDIPINIWNEVVQRATP